MLALACDPPTETESTEHARHATGPKPTEQAGRETAPESLRDAAPPAPVRVTLNGLPAAVSALLFVPPSGFVVRVEGVHIEAARVTVRVSAASGSAHDWSEAVPRDGATRVWIVPERHALAEGTHTMRVEVTGPKGDEASDALTFAVRPFGEAGPPIGQGQHVWLDFDADRDRAPGPDFDADLGTFGLVSPELSADAAERVRRRVIDAALARVRSAYADADPTGLQRPDPVAVEFSTQDPSAPDTTRICVGGADPTGGHNIGHVALDPRNARRSDVVCGPWPAGGVYPRALLTYAEQPAFRDAFDSLRLDAGGVPVGRHPLDAIILARGLDAGMADAPIAQRKRALAIQRGLDAFAQALGSVLAHETGHALGLVPIGLPGVGLYGGSEGEAFAHNTSSLGPSQGQRQRHGQNQSRPLLMDPGRRFTFANLAGPGDATPISFGSLNHAYLRDRVVLTSGADAIRDSP